MANEQSQISLFEKKPFELKIALDTLRHLGINLYSSLPPVLSELVANSYDARARTVRIYCSDDQVIIEDDGIGMSRVDMQEKYLIIGRDRRVEENKDDLYPDWPVRSKPMGRKGIGKLSMFSIANEVKIFSIKDGEKVAIRMLKSDIERTAKVGQTYNPKELDWDIDLERGTKIILSDLGRIRKISESVILRAIVKRFSVVDLSIEDTEDSNDLFKVYVNGKKATYEHWDIYKSLQYIWYIGDESEIYVKRCPGDTIANKLDDNLVYDDQKRQITGWIGTVELPDQLKYNIQSSENNSEHDSEDIIDNDNKIVVDCRGKVAINNFLYQFAEAGIYASYLVGYIRADFLDDEVEDIATSDRERMKEDDPKVVALRKEIKKYLSTIQSQWTKLRKDSALGRARKDPKLGPVIDEWLGSLNNDEKKDAALLLGKLSTTRFSHSSDMNEVLKYGILAFERLRAQKRLNEIRFEDTELNLENRLSVISQIFAMERDLENALYADIISQRLEVIKKLKELEKSNALEDVLQDHIYDNLWLIEPSWTKSDFINPVLEQSVKTEFNNVTGLSNDEKKGRVDIRYRTSAGTHIIVELKRPSVKIGPEKLLLQLRKYKNALSKCLKETKTDDNPNIRCVCIVGSHYEDDDESDRLMLAANTKVLKYKQIIYYAEDRYQEYLEAHNKFGHIQSIIKKLT